MKATFTKPLLAILVLIISLPALGQKGVEDGSKYGKGQDSIRCVKNLSLYIGNYRNDEYANALPYWHIVFNECPKSSFNLYIHGINMYKTLMKNAENKEQQYAYLDTVMAIYDKRIKYFGHKGKVMGRKGMDWLALRKNTIEEVKKGYKFLEQSIDLQKNKSENAVLALFMNSSNVLFQANELSREQMIQNYAKASDIAEYKIRQKPNNDTYVKLKQSIDGIFSKSGAATCESLIKLFTPKYEKTPDDKELLKKITDFLAGTDCKDADLYYRASTSLHKIDPSAKSAYKLAEMNVDRDNYTEACKLYRQAIELETDKKEKSKYYLKLGDITFHNLGNNSLARSYARKAAELEPESGNPYLLLGAIYADSEPCGDDEIAEKALYWIAVDQFIKARQIDSGLTELATKSINAYSQHFPDTETIFFHGLEKGGKYTVGCWINETTIIRAR